MDLPCLSQYLVQAAEHVLAAVGESTPGVRVTDHYQIPVGLMASSTRLRVSFAVAPVTSGAAISIRHP